MQKWLIILCSLWLVCFLSSAIGNVNQFNNLYVYSNFNHCRLVFSTTSLFHYHYFILTNPNRLVFDIQNTNIVCSFSSQFFKKTPIIDARTAMHKNALRIVFDLKYPVKVSVSVRSCKHKHSSQLLVDLTNLLSPWPYDMHTNSHNRASDVIVVIDPGHGGCDPGHGGCDPGATGFGGVYEKDIVLKIALDLQKDINRQPGFKAYLTRNDDYYLTLRQRLSIARYYRADLFIAIHADSCKDHEAHGASVFVLSSYGATTEAVRWLVKKENESELMGGVNLTNKNNLLRSVLINLSQTATIHASLLIGEKIIHTLNSISLLHYHHVEQANFVVLKSPDIISLLIETGFISNYYEEHRLLNHTYQRRIASAIMRGIRDYFTHSPPCGTWLAEKKFTAK